MAEAGIRDYPRDEIIQHHAELQQLLLDMAARSAGGRRASGRYKAYDTARLLYIKTVAFPSLRLGKRIDTEDWRLATPRGTFRRSQHRWAGRARIGWTTASAKTTLDAP